MPPASRRPPEAPARLDAVPSCGYWRGPWPTQYRAGRAGRGRLRDARDGGLGIGAVAGQVSRGARAGDRPPTRIHQSSDVEFVQVLVDVAGEAADQAGEVVAFLGRPVGEQRGEPLMPRDEEPADRRLPLVAEPQLAHSR